MTNSVHTAQGKARRLIVLYLLPTIIAYAVGFALLIKYYPQFEYQVWGLSLIASFLLSFSLGKYIKRKTGSVIKMEKPTIEEVKKNRRKVIIYGVVMLVVFIASLALIIEYSPNYNFRLIGIGISIVVFLFSFFKVVDTFKVE